MRPRRITRAFGWFSLGLGMAELIAPRRVGKSVGVRGHTGLLRFIGLREIVTGIGILSARQRSPWMWSRVAGDIMDLAALTAAVPEARHRDERGRIATAAAAVTGVAVADVLCSRTVDRQSREDEFDDGAVQFKRTITIARPADELYRFWRNFENLPAVLPNLKAVHVIAGDPAKSRWIAEGPRGKTLEWDAELIDDRAGEIISWRSLPGSDVDTRGAVRFTKAPGRRGTVVTVEMSYTPPARNLGAKVARLFGDAPEEELFHGLRQFKQLMETGEIITTEGQPAARTRNKTKYEGLVRSWAANS